LIRSVSAVKCGTWIFDTWVTSNITKYSCSQFATGIDQVALMIHHSPTSRSRIAIGRTKDTHVLWSANKKLSQSFRSSQNTPQSVGLVPINELTYRGVTFNQAD